MASGVDDIVPAFTADAYSRTGRSHAYSLSASSDPIHTRHGLTLIPDRVVGGNNALDVILPKLEDMPSMRVPDNVLAAIVKRYGRSTAYGVALDFEYPGFLK